jgi:thiamine-phosphate pyrophosphorylase
MDEKPCGLICVIPAALQAEWATNLTEITKRFMPAALILKGNAPDALGRIVAAAKSLELAVLFVDAPGEVRDAGANGVYFSSPGADLAKARAALGSAAVLGVACGLSRHEAMDSAEAGADFIAFDASNPTVWEKTVELSSWWDGITGVPAALDFQRARPNRAVLSKARSDFLLIEEMERAGESLTFATEFGLQSQT